MLRCSTYPSFSNGTEVEAASIYRGSCSRSHGILAPVPGGAWAGPRGTEAERLPQTPGRGAGRRAGSCLPCFSWARAGLASFKTAAGELVVLQNKLDFEIRQIRTFLTFVLSSDK